MEKLYPESDVELNPFVSKYYDKLKPFQISTQTIEIRQKIYLCLLLNSNGVKIHRL
jgi:hypothetical protein